MLSFLEFFLCNVVWSQLGNISQSFYMCSVVPRVLRQHWTEFFPVQCCLEPIGQHCTRFLPVQCCPQEYYNFTEQDFFMCNVVWRLLDNIAQGFYLCNVVPKVLRQHWTGFFPVQCCVQDFFLCNVVCSQFLPVQCCPKSIKATLSRFFSCVMFSGVSWSNYQDFVFSWNLSFGKKFGRNS